MRREMEIPVWVEALPRRPGHPALIRALTRDISHRGAFLWVPPVFSLGQKLHLEMEVAPKAGDSLELRIECAAEVVRLRSPSQEGEKAGIGVRFLKFAAPVPIYGPPD